MKKQKLTSVKDYAHKKGVSMQYIYRQAKAGKIKSVKQFGVILIVEWPIR